MRNHRRPLFIPPLLILAFWMLASACRTVSFSTPTSSPILPTQASITAAMASPVPTSLGVVLPLVMHSEESPTAELSSTSAPAQMATSIPTEVPTLSPEVTQISAPDITLLFTGVIVPARCVQAAIDERGDANYVYDEVRQVITQADLAVGTLNTTLSDLSDHTGCVQTYVLVSDARSAQAAAAAGFDVMSVATNHIKNCNGPSCTNNYNQAFLDTLENLRLNNILSVGAGANMAEAMQPLVVEVKGVRFGFVSLGMIEPMAFAGQDWPGIAELNEENLRTAIQAVKAISDVTIAMPHWGPEDTSNPNSYQLDYAAIAVDAGADVVVGNHTHVVQAVQQINGVDVFYGLGNFIFDQTWDLAHQQGVILILHFSGASYTGYELIPTHVDGDGTVHIAEGDEANSILQRIEDASAWLP